MNIKEKIEAILEELVPGIDVSSKDLMKEEGVGSLTMIQIISELDLEFDIEITYEDIENKSFQSVKTIEKMVQKHLDLQ